MLVDYTNQRRAAGETIRTLIQTNHARLRPILMTTIACLNVHCIALEQVPNGKRLAWVIIGGLISSSLR
jgi:HAE1 family hydrophobic/amphiphilic exporter-1